MKHINILAAIMLLLISGQRVCAQTENGFKEIDVANNFGDNPFTFFTRPLLLMAGDSLQNNAMTIGWGAVGTLWGRDRNTMTVYVAEKRYTHSLMEKTKYFTVMMLDSHPEVLEYMGTHSGRDGDKTKALGLHVAYTKNGAPYYEEADAVYECELMYGAPFDPKGFRNSVPKDFYAHFGAGFHSMYIGEVTGAWSK